MRVHLDTSALTAPIRTRCGGSRSHLDTSVAMLEVTCLRCLRLARQDKHDVALGHPADWRERIK